MLTVEGEPVEQVSNFVYLGANISGDGTIDRDLDIRIQRANGAFHQLWKIWNYKNAHQDPYLQGCCYYDSVIWS